MIEGDDPVLAYMRDAARWCRRRSVVRCGSLALAPPLLARGLEDVAHAPQRERDAGDLVVKRNVFGLDVLQVALDRLAHLIEPALWKIALHIAERADRQAQRFVHAAGKRGERALG